VAFVIAGRSIGIIDFWFWVLDRYIKRSILSETLSNSACQYLMEVRRRWVVFVEH